MKENKNPFDEHIQNRLSDFESPVPMGLFDRLQAQRGGALPSDDFLRTRLEGHESPVSDKVFDNVMAERQRRNRRVWLWRSATAIAALWLLGIVLVQLQNKNTIPDVENQMSDVGKPATSDISNNGTNDGVTNTEGVTNVEKSAASDASNTIENASNTEGANVELKNNNSTVSPSKGLSNNVNTEGGANVEFRKSNFRKSSKTGIPNSVVISESNSELKNSNSVSNASKNASNTEGVSDVGNRVSDFGNAPTSDITIPKSNGFEFINKNAELNSVAENQLTSLDRTVASFDLLTLKTPKLLILTKETRKNPCSVPDNGCPTFGVRRRGFGERAFYVDAFVAPEYVMRSFIKNLPESEKLITARDSVEKTQYAVSTGVRASFVLGNGLAIRAGAIYNQINEKARFDSLGIGTITTTYKVNSLPNGQLDTVSVIRTITDGIFRKTRYNHYRTIDIPVQIGFEKNLKNGWGIGVNGGAIFNITAWRKADIVGTDLRQVTVSSGINEPNFVFSTRLGVSLTGSVAVYRQLTDNLQIVAEPTLRYGLQPITRADYAVKQQYSTVGMLMGLRLKL